MQKILFLFLLIVMRMSALVALQCAVPENVILIKTETVFELSWDAVTEDIAGNPISPDYYNVYRSEGSLEGDFELIASPQSNFYIFDYESELDIAFFKVTAEKEFSQIPDSSFVLLTGGSFIMGRTRGGGDANELPTHLVTLNSFYIDKYELTQAKYFAVMNTNPSNFIGENRPVEQVSWFDAILYCNARSVEEGLTPAYNTDDWTCDFSANGYRLPTEAEWEYAARGGSNNPDYYYSASDELNNVAWYLANSESSTHDVGSKTPNSLGLYDMSGNIRELCYDQFGNYDASNQSNPSGPTSGFFRVDRGGSWNGEPTNCRVVARSYVNPYTTDYRIGFRIVRNAE